MMMTYESKWSESIFVDTHGAIVSGGMSIIGRYKAKIACFFEYKNIFILTFYKSLN